VHDDDIDGARDAAAEQGRPPAAQPSTPRPTTRAPRSAPRPRKPPRTAEERSAAAKKAAATRAANARARAEAAAAAEAAARAVSEAEQADDLPGAQESREAGPATGPAPVVDGASALGASPDGATPDGATPDAPSLDAAPGDAQGDLDEPGLATERAEEPAAGDDEPSADVEDDVPAAAPATDVASAEVAASADVAGTASSPAGPSGPPAVVPTGSGRSARFLRGVRAAVDRAVASGRAAGDARRTSSSEVVDEQVEVGEAAPVDEPAPVDEVAPAVDPVPVVEPEPEAVDEALPVAEAAPSDDPVPSVDDTGASAGSSPVERTTRPAAAPRPAPVAPAADAPVVLSISGLVKRYGSTTAVEGVDLEVRAGSFTGIVGPNGAGKTTTLSIVTGLLRPDAGTVTVLGSDVWADPAAAKRSLGVLPDRLRLFDRLTGAQLLYYSATLRGLDGATARKRSSDLAAAFGLQDALGRLVSDYSVGMTKKIALAAAIIHSPRVLVLDEPFESVDPVSAATVTDVLQRYVAGGGTVLLSSHSMDLVERICDSVAVIVDGHVLASGPVDEVRAGRSLEERFVELAGGRAVTEGMEWLQNFSD